MYAVIECPTPKDYKDERRKAQINNAVKRHRQKHPDRAKERDRQYYESHKDEIRRKRREKRRRDSEKDNDDERYS